MKLIACFLCFSLFSPVLFADVTVVKRNTQPGVDDAILIAGYDQKIDQLDQMSDQLSSQIFSKKGSLNEKGPDRHGVSVALIKVKAR